MSELGWWGFWRLVGLLPCSCFVYYSSSYILLSDPSCSAVHRYVRTYGSRKAVLLSLSCNSLCHSSIILFQYHGRSSWLCFRYHGRPSRHNIVSPSQEFVLSPTLTAYATTQPMEGMSLPQSVANCCSTRKYVGIITKIPNLAAFTGSAGDSQLHYALIVIITVDA